LICGAHAVCFCTLVTILDPPLIFFIGIKNLLSHLLLIPVKEILTLLPLLMLLFPFQFAFIPLSFCVFCFYYR
jgi:hypothetical protein